MPRSPEEFYQHAVAAADDAQHLPLARMTGWDIGPFEANLYRIGDGGAAPDGPSGGEPTPARGRPATGG